MVDPEEQAVKLGMDAIFKCHSKTRPKWFFRGQPQLLNTMLHNKEFKLRIRNVMHNDRGYYECEGKKETGESFNSRGLLRISG